MEIKINTLSGSLSGAAYTTLLNSGGHLFYADEPLDHGGSNKGPRPHDFLLAALASCTCITVRMYADRKGWKLDDVTTNVKMERQVVSGVQQTKIVQELSFTGDLDDDQIARLLVISGKCPVHKTLSNSIAIENKLYVIY